MCACVGSSSLDVIYDLSSDAATVGAVQLANEFFSMTLLHFISLFLENKEYNLKRS